MRGGTAFRVGLLVLTALLWGGAATFIKYALDSWQPLTLLTVQLIGANIVLWVALLIRGYRRPPGLRRLALLGLLEPGLCYALITIGLQHTSAANAAVLAGLESCFVVVLAAIFLRERIVTRSLVGLLLAVAGILALGNIASGLSMGAGDLLVLAAIFCAAVHVLVARRVAGQLDALTMTAHQFAFGLAVVAPFAVGAVAVGAEQLPTRHSATGWLLAVAIGVIGFAVSFLLYNYAIAGVSAGRASMIINLLPVFGVGTAVLLLGERLGGWQLLGAGLVVLSLFVFPAEPDEPAPAVVPDPVTEFARR